MVLGLDERQDKVAAHQQFSGLGMVVGPHMGRAREQRQDKDAARQQFSARGLALAHRPLAPLGLALQPPLALGEEQGQGKVAAHHSVGQLCGSQYKAEARQHIWSQFEELELVDQLHKGLELVAQPLGEQPLDMALVESLDMVAAHRLAREPELAPASQLELGVVGEHPLALGGEQHAQLEQGQELEPAWGQAGGQQLSWSLGMVEVVEQGRDIVAQLQRSSPQLEPARIFELPAHSVQQSVQSRSEQLPQGQAQGQHIRSMGQEQRQDTHSMGEVASKPW